MIYEILDWLVLTFGFLGAILVIYRNKNGYLCFIIHSIFWGLLSYKDGNFGAVITCIFFIAIDVFGYYKWSVDDTRAKVKGER